MKKCEKCCKLVFNNHTCKAYEVRLIRVVNPGYGTDSNPPDLEIRDDSDHGIQTIQADDFEEAAIKFTSIFDDCDYDVVGQNEELQLEITCNDQTKFFGVSGEAVPEYYANEIKPDLKWAWKMDYCKKHDIPPAEMWAWKQADDAYIKEFS